MFARDMPHELEPEVAKKARGYVKDMLEGNAVFRNINETLIGALATIQHPKFEAVGCADSRVPLEKVIGADVGESFTVRLAGNVLDASGIGTIEYGVEHLHIHMLIFLGHTGCGAVTAGQALMKKVVSGELDEFDIPERRALDRVVKEIYNNIKDNPKNAQDLDTAVLNNSKAEIAKLIKSSDIVGKALRDGKLTILLGMYDMRTGAVIDKGELGFVSARYKDKDGSVEFTGFAVS